MDSMYLDNLNEFIYDEGRIVTYKYLSLILNVDVNIAKQMLYDYVTKQRSEEKGDDLNVTYFVCGRMAGQDKQPDRQKMMVVTEEKLSTLRSQLKEVLSVHIYSIAKAKMKDLSVLYTANYEEVKRNMSSINNFSGIKCPSAKVKSEADLQKLVKENAYQAPEDPSTKQKQPKPEVKKEKTVEPVVKKEPKKPSNQIASMFARQNVKSEEKKEDKKTETKKTPSAGPQKKGGISAFLSKAPSKPTRTPDSSKSSPVKTDTDASPGPSVTESLVSSIKTESQDTITSDSQPGRMEVDSPSPKKEKVSPPPKKEKAKGPSKSKPKKASHKRTKSKHSDNESPIPKRKRIMALSDSDSSSEEENEEEESPIPDPSRIESDEEVSPSPPKEEPKEEVLSKNGRPKKRKLVPKTFMDDDGYLVTKKEYVYVSDSDAEEQVDANQENIPAKQNTASPQKKPAAKSPQKKTAAKSPQKKTAAKSPQKKHSKDTTKTKQSSIMSFFGKK